MVLITAIISLAVGLWSLAEVGQTSRRLGWHGLFQTLIGGVTGAFLTGTCSTSMSGSRCC